MISLHIIPVHVQSSDIGVKPYPRDIMNWTEQIYGNVFKKQQFCLKENDYVFGDHKVGGNAQGTGGITHRVYLYIYIYMSVYICCHVAWKAVVLLHSDVHE